MNEEARAAKAAYIRALYAKVYGPRDRKIRALAKSGVSQAEIARRIGLTRQRVHQILNREE